MVSAVLSDPGVQEARARVEAAETELGMELCGHLQPFQDRYDQAVRDATRTGSPGSVRASTAAGDGSVSYPTVTRSRWRNRTGVAPARAGRSRGEAAPDDW